MVSSSQPPQSPKLFVPCLYFGGEYLFTVYTALLFTIGINLRFLAIHINLLGTRNNGIYQAQIQVQTPLFECHIWQIH
jgi:hypothetical protein